MVLVGACLVLVAAVILGKFVVLGTLAVSLGKLAVLAALAGRLLVYLVDKVVLEELNILFGSKYRFDLGEVVATLFVASLLAGVFLGFGLGLFLFFQLFLLFLELLLLLHFGFLEFLKLSFLLLGEVEAFERFEDVTRFATLAGTHFGAVLVLRLGVLVGTLGKSADAG